MAYNDIFIRDTLDDTGNIPSSTRCISFSPDIIPVGAKPLSNPLDLIYNDWDINVGKDLIQGYNNYIYVRGQNHAPNAAEGELSLYYSPSSILLTPNFWRYNKIPSSATTAPKFKASTYNERLLADNTFLWNAPAQPSGWHYCLIARVSTKDHPNEIPADFTNSGGFVEWVRNNPGIAWRNVYIQKRDSQSVRSYLFKFENIDNFQEKYAIRAECKNMPKNTKVTLSCGALGPYPQINITQTLSGNSIEYVYTQSLLPAKFEGNLVVTIELPSGTSWPVGGEVNPSYLKLVGGMNLTEEQHKNHKLLSDYALHPKEFGLDSSHTQEEQLVLLGDCKVVFE